MRNEVMALFLGLSDCTFNTAKICILATEDVEFGLRDVVQTIQKTEDFRFSS